MNSMADQSKIPEPVSEMLYKWGSKIADLKSDLKKIDYIRQYHSSLLKNTDFFRFLLENISGGKSFPDIRRCEIFETEMLLYIHPNRHFSLRFAILAPGECTVIHDHNSWGVIGAVSGCMEVVKYQRIDEGSGENHAILREKEQLFLDPGETDFTLPENDGIHKTGNPTQKTIVTASIYGKPIRDRKSVV